MEKWAGLFLVAVSATGFGLMSSFARLASKLNVNLFTLLSFRFLLAFLILLAICIFTKKSFHLAFKKIIIISLLGIFGYAVMAYLLFSSYNYMPASIATIIFYAYPLLTYVISIISRHEDFKLSKAGILLICLFGLFISIYSGGEIEIIGLVFAIGAGLIYSLFIFISDTFIKDIPSVVSSTMICLTSGLTLLFIGISRHQVSPHVSMEGWAIITALSIASTVIPIVFFFNGVKLIGATNSAIVSIIEPITSMLFSMLFFHDVLNRMQMTGIVIVLVATISSQLNFDKRSMLNNFSN